MRPAFRSNRSAIAFSALVFLLLALPVILHWIGSPSREQDFISISNRAGPVGYNATEIYDDPRDADVVVVGSSRVLLNIRSNILEKALTAHLGRPAHVVTLTLNWPGEDMRSYMLRDYLTHHRARLILWNIPQAKAFNNQPHVQAYLWARYGEYEGQLSKLPFLYRTVLYGEMIFGAPREALTKLRPNLIGGDERDFSAYARYMHQDPEHKLGYMGAPFVPDSFPAPAPDERYLIPVTSPLLTAAGPFPGPYQLRFIHEIADLAREHHSRLVLLHIPETEEFGDTTIPELVDWAKVLGPDYTMIAAPASVLFAGITPQRRLHLYADDLHFSNNGAIWFSEKIVPSVLEAYDDAAK